MKLPRGLLWAPTGSILRTPLTQFRLFQRGERRYAECKNTVAPKGIIVANCLLPRWRFAEMRKHRCANGNRGAFLNLRRSFKKDWVEKL